MSKLKNLYLAHQLDQKPTSAQPLGTTRRLKRGRKNVKKQQLSPAKCVGRLLKGKGF